MTYSQNLLPMPIKDMCRKAPVRRSHLSDHRIPHTQLHLRHVTNVASFWIHDDILVGLLKTNHDIHELQLPGHYYSGIPEYTRSRMPLIEYAIWIFGYVDRREEVVFLGVLIS